jgi:hypothetical protein
METASQAGSPASVQHAHQQQHGHLEPRALAPPQPHHAHQQQQHQQADHNHHHHDPQPAQQHEHDQLLVPLLALLATINLIVILGNILVIVAVHASAKLRSVTNIFIVSLATADLLLGLFVLPYALVYEVSRVESSRVEPTRAERLRGRPVGPLPRWRPLACQLAHLLAHWLAWLLLAVALISVRLANLVR